MPPKKAKAPEPPPEPAVEVRTGPEPVLVDGIPVPPTWLKQLKHLEMDSAHLHMKERSADIRLDPKMRAMQSISELKRNASLPALGPRERERIQAKDAQEKHLKLLHAEAMGRQRRSSRELQIPQHIPEETRKLFEKRKSLPDPDPMGESMRRKAPLLLANVELAHGEMLHKSSPVLRCTTLDRVHGWYDKHRTKDSSSHQKRDAPAYLKFDKDDATMSGSLRTEPNERRYAPLPCDQLPSQKPAWLVNGMRKASSETYLG